jgi:hypothetical protein
MFYALYPVSSICKHEKYTKDKRSYDTTDSNDER